MIIFICSKNMWINNILGLLFICWVVSDSLRPRGLQHARLLSSIISWSLLKLMFIESVMPSNHLILCCPLLLLSSIFASLGVFQGVGSWHQVADVLELEHQSFQWIFRVDLRLTGFSSTTLRRHQFFGAQPSLWSNFTSIHDY